MQHTQNVRDRFEVRLVGTAYTLVTTSLPAGLARPLSLEESLFNYLQARL